MAAPNAAHEITARPARKRTSSWLRLRVLLTRAVLDARIARGAQASAAETLRAEQLRRPAVRCRVGKALRMVVDAAQDPPSGLSAAPLLNRRGIEANRTWILELADALEQRPAVESRAVAMTAVLLHDGGSPLYDGTDGGALHDAVLDALMELG
jgi:hypothetical protein